MALKSKELCRRVRLRDSAVTFHVIGKDGHTLVEVSESTYREFEASAFRTDTLYSKNDKLFQRAFKTVYFN